MSADTKKKHKLPLLLWLDLETTGLDERRGDILEVAWVLVEVMPSGQWVELDAFAQVMPVMDDMLKRCDPYALKMHAQTGLLSAARDAYQQRMATVPGEKAPLAVHEVGTMLFETLMQHTDDKRDIRLAGYSVGSFDLRWIEKHWPLAAGLLSHRVMDVSSLRLFVEMIDPDALYPKDKEVTHRAKDDLRVSQRELLDYLWHFGDLHRGVLPPALPVPMPAEAPRLVIIESPYAGDVERNVRYARACMADSLARGEAPLASHLLYTQPGILDDRIPEERIQGIEAGLAWGRCASLSAFYVDLGMSPGMELGLARARDAGRGVVQRTISGWDAGQEVAG